MGGNRFCARLQREHRSNHVMIVVELTSGVFYQKCLDPDCRRLGFQSDKVFLPMDLIPFIEHDSPIYGATEEQLEDMFLHDLDDSFFNDVADDISQTS